ncbi:hypothetical protein GCM10020331_095380 [Ectobacillus funiculus]
MRQKFIEQRATKKRNFQKNPEMKVVREGTANWQRAEAMKLTEKLDSIWSEV